MRLCRFFGFTRQAYYKQLREQQDRLEKDQLVVHLVQQEKRGNKMMGGRKLYYKLGERIRNMNHSLGRDKFFALLRRHDLLVKRRRKYAVTTQSRHRFRRYNNILKDFQPLKPNQAWVGDITYIRTKGGFVYLFLLTDVYSRKIVGWHLNKNMGIEDGLKAAAMAKRQCVDTTNLIHHTDRGIQYCAPLYTGTMEKAGIQMSMGEAGNCYDNAIAERVNGILKGEYAMDSTFDNLEEALVAVRQSIKHYNEQRPHWSLKLKTPAEVHVR
jgi:transposase InsO family protein